MTSKDIRNYLGQHLKFTFQNGVELYATIDKVFPEEGPVQLIQCGPSDINGIDSLPEETAHPQSLLLVPSTISRVKEIKRKSELDAGETEPKEFVFSE